MLGVAVIQGQMQDLLPCQQGSQCFTRFLLPILADVNAQQHQLLSYTRSLCWQAH